MDWWRTKWLFIALFLALDILLLIQLRRMRLPVVPLPAHSVLSLSAARPPDLPLLEVRTLGWSDGDEALLTGTPTCTPPIGPEDAARSCAVPGTGETLDWIGGALTYSSPSGVPFAALSRAAGEAEATALARQLVGRLNPGLGPADFSVTPLGGDAGDRITAAETYEGRPLFGAYWFIEVRPRSVDAIRSPWLDVIGPAGAPARVSSAASALAAAARVYGQAAVTAAGQQPTLGYYAPLSGERAGGAPWCLWPTYRLRLSGNQCVYIDAVAGSVQCGAGGRPTSFGQGLISPQTC